MAGAPTSQAGEASSSSPGWTEEEERREEGEGQMMGPYEACQ